MVKRLLSISILLTSVLLSSLAMAQFREEGPRINDLGLNDQNFLERQREKIDRIARLQLGSQLRGDLRDLTVLQQIIDRKLIPTTNTEDLQALGAVLGEVMRADVPSLEWKIYEDKIGRSRALCARGTQECLFPITMLSRRIEVGLFTRRLWRSWIPMSPRFPTVAARRDVCAANNFQPRPSPAEAGLFVFSRIN
jgi:hypothetical protein